MDEKDRKIIKIADPMEFIISKRLNRFVVEVLLDGKPFRAYINNTGRLLEYLIKGRRGFCTKTEKTEKTSCRLFSVRENNLGAIIDTQLQMKAFEKALEMKLISWIGECKILKSNAKMGSSLIDYLLKCDGKKVYLEVKSAVLRDGKYAMYPDCPSSRGRRHIEELTDHVKNGGRGILLFIAALPGVEAFRPNRSADPEMYELLQEAYKAGVDVKSIGLYYNPEDSFLYLFNPDLEIDLF